MQLPIDLVFGFTSSARGKGRRPRLAQTPPLTLPPRRAPPGLGPTRVDSVAAGSLPGWALLSTSGGVTQMSLRGGGRTRGTPPGPRTGEWTFIGVDLIQY